MVEVFITDIKKQDQLQVVQRGLVAGFPDLKICFDLNETGLPFPCGHTVLRVEGQRAFDQESIIATVCNSGFSCNIMEDKICKKEAPKPEFWETAFLEKQEMWGLEPALSALLAKDFFLENGVQNVLIPGFGYGRNAAVFQQIGMSVTGIEISKTAIEMARKHYGDGTKIHHGSVSEMPFDEHRYEGIFCHALIHLLDGEGRAKLIQDCYSQLENGGCMVFTAISKSAHTYGTGKHIGPDRYELFGGVRLYFYDEAAVRAEFGRFGLLEILEVQEGQPFFLVKCRKGWGND